MPKTCSVNKCRNNAKKDKSKFSYYKFPGNEPERRSLWAKACNRVTKSGEPWRPKDEVRNVYVCSAHFITGKPDNNRLHPDYIPNVFPDAPNKQVEEENRKKLKRYLEYRAAYIRSEEDSRAARSAIKDNQVAGINHLPTANSSTGKPVALRSILKTQRSGTTVLNDSSESEVQCVSKKGHPSPVHVSLKPAPSSEVAREETKGINRPAESICCYANDGNEINGKSLMPSLIAEIPQDQPSLPSNIVTVPETSSSGLAVMANTVAVSPDPNEHHSVITSSTDTSQLNTTDHLVHPATAQATDNIPNLKHFTVDMPGTTLGNPLPQLSANLSRSVSHGMPVNHRTVTPSLYRSILKPTSRAQGRPATVNIDAGRKSESCTTHRMSSLIPGGQDQQDEEKRKKLKRKQICTSTTIKKHKAGHDSSLPKTKRSKTTSADTITVSQPTISASLTTPDASSSNQELAAMPARPPGPVLTPLAKGSPQFTHPKISHQPSSEPIGQATTDITIQDPTHPCTVQPFPPVPAPDLLNLESLQKELSEMRKTILEQEIQIEYLHAKLNTVRLSVELIWERPEKSKFYTGLDWKNFYALYRYLCNYIEPNGACSLTNIDQLFYTLLRLRHGDKFQRLADHAGVSETTMTNYFWKWIDLICQMCQFIIDWPDRDWLRKNIPPVFKAFFPRLTVIIDCFEIFIEAPGNLKARAQCYSNYKKHTTVKFLIGCNPLGAVSFLSKAFGGRASDVEIVKQSGFLDTKYHFPGDQVLADRGFTFGDELGGTCGAELLTPSFIKGKSQFSAKELEVSRHISSIRIHIERVIGHVKNKFSILQQTLPLQMIKRRTDEAQHATLASVDKLVRCCSILTNLSPSIVYKE